MEPETEEVEISEPAPDRAVRRARLYLSTAIIVGGLVTGASALAVKMVTSDVSRDLHALATSVESQRESERAYAEMDSVRFERAMEVLELAVTAIVSPDGSPEQKSALDELKSRRHVVTP